MRVITQEQQDALMAKIKHNASNNTQKQAYIKPSEFGFVRGRVGTDECIDFLKRQRQIRSVKSIGHDLLDITLK